MTGTNKSVLLNYNRHVIARHANELEVDSSGRVPSKHVMMVIASAKNHCGPEASWEYYCWGRPGKRALQGDLAYLTAVFHR